MIKKTVLGIDIGTERLKLALIHNGNVIKTVSTSMPKDLYKDGIISSNETVSDLIKQTMKENKIHAKYAAILLSNENVYIKNVRLPMMNTEQLEYNLPYEFNDYITTEIEDYLFDYAVLYTKEDENLQMDVDATLEEYQKDDEEIKETIELMAVCCKKEIVESARYILKRAGLKMVVAVPVISSFINLIYHQKKELEKYGDEYGILDLGSSSVRLYIFKNEHHVVTRILEIGLHALDEIIADALSVNAHIAHTYLLNNFDNCQARDQCMEFYEKISVELMRALNFYHFSNPDSNLADLWLCGGGAMIQPLVESLKDILDMEMHDASELVPGKKTLPDYANYLQAIGIAMQEGS